MDLRRFPTRCKHGNPNKCAQNAFHSLFTKSMDLQVKPHLKSPAMLAIRKQPISGGDAASPGHEDHNTGPRSLRFRA